MQYLKYTHVDAVTGRPVTQAPATNGPAAPAVAGLQFVWARESLYPTDTPELFGTCPDGADTAIPGVLGVFSAADWEVMHADELAARVRLLPGRRITRLAFRNRFTLAEKAALELASIDSPAAPMAQRQQAAVLRAYLADLAAANYVDLARADTRAGVHMLESAGLLAAGRALEILDAPIQALEV